MDLNSSSRKLVLRAVSDISAGYDVVIVAYPHDIAVVIARTVCKVARSKKLSCANLPECHGIGPRVKVREYDAEIPFPTPKSKVHIDVSAVFERGCYRVSSVRTVF